MSLKLFGKNATIYAIGNMILRGVAFLLIPLYTHYLSLEEYGLLASLFVTIEFVLILMGLGMRTTLERFYKEFEVKNLLGRLLGTTILINFAGGVIISTICIFALLPFFSRIFHTDNVFIYVLLACLASLIQSLFLQITSYYRAKSEAMKFMVASISAAVLLILTNIIFLMKLNLGIKGAIVAQVISYGIILILISINIFSKTGIDVSIPLAKKLFKFGFPLVFSMSGQRIIGVASMYILSFVAGLQVVGIYALGNKLAKLISIVLILPFQMAFQPFVFTNLDKPNIKTTIAKLFTYFIFAIAFFSFAMLIGARLIIPMIAPPAYSSAYLVVLLLLPALAFQGLSVFGEALLSIEHKTYITGIVFGIGGVLSILLNLIFIPLFSWYGVVITLYVSYITIGASILILGLRAYPLKLEWRRLGIATGLFSSFLLLVLTLKPVNDITFYSTTILAAVFSMAFIYFGNILNAKEQVFINKILSGIQLKVSR